MRLSNENRINQPLRENLERLRLTLDYDRGSWAELLKMTESEYGLFLTGRKKLGALQLGALSERIHLSLDAFVQDRIDFKAVAAQHQGFSTYIPEKYTIAARSKRRTSITVLDYLEKYFGWRTRHSVLRHTQVQESSFSDPEKVINLKFLNDTLKFLSTNGFNSDSLAAMGMHSAITNSHSPIAHNLRAFRNPKDLFEHALTHLVPTYFDQNHTYRILALDDTTCTVDISTDEELRAKLPLADIASPELCAYRRGVGMSFSAYAGFPFSKITETACVHQGAKACRLVIDFSEAAWVAASMQPAANPRYFQ